MKGYLTTVITVISSECRSSSKGKHSTNKQEALISFQTCRHHHNHGNVSCLLTPQCPCALHVQMHIINRHFFPMSSRFLLAQTKRYSLCRLFSISLGKSFMSMSIRLMIECSTKANFHSWWPLNANGFPSLGILAASVIADYWAAGTATKKVTIQ